MQLSSLSTINTLTYDKRFIPCQVLLMHLGYLTVAKAISEELQLNPNANETLRIMNFKDGLKFCSYHISLSCCCSFSSQGARGFAISFPSFCEDRLTLVGYHVWLFMQKQLLTED